MDADWSQQALPPSLVPSRLLSWRHLHRGEIDHELLWLAVSVSTAVAAWGWLHFGMPTPVCTFHALTGWACPTCGATRAVVQLFRGNIAGALHFNPLVAGAAFAVLLFDLYAATVLFGRLPRLRFARMPPRIAWSLRAAVLGAVALNWMWLVWAGI